MSTSERLGKVGETLARGVAAEKVDRLDDSADHFKGEAAVKIENLAKQLRELGHRYHRASEAHQLARRLEKTADYLRFRPVSKVAEDAWQTTRKHHLLWWTGGLLAGVIVYRMMKRQIDD